MSAYLFQIAGEKSFDYLFIIYVRFNFNFLLSIATFCSQFQLSTLFGLTDVLSANQ